MDRVQKTADHQPLFRAIEGIHGAQQTLEALDTDYSAITDRPDYPLLRMFGTVFAAGRYRTVESLVAKHLSDCSMLFYPGSGLCCLADEFRSLPAAELDFGEMAEKKRQLVKALEMERPDYHICSGDVRDWESVRGSISLAQNGPEKRPVLWVNIGLANYFDQSGLGAYAENLQRVLTDFGGVCINADNNNNERIRWAENEYGDEWEAGRSLLLAKTGKDMAANCLFEDAAEVADYYSRHGFNVTRYPFSDSAPRLQCLAELGLTAEQAEHRLRYWEVLEISR